MEPTDYSDEELVTHAVSQQEYFGVIIDRYSDKLRRYIRRLGVATPDDQDDVLQEVFIKVYRNLNGFDTSLSFSSWIYRIAHNESISWYRKRNARPEGHMVSEGDDIVSLVADEERGAEQALSVSYDVEAMNAAMRTLEAKYQQVLILRFFEHKEYDEISDILKIPIGSVGTHIFRAKKKLRTLLQVEHA